MSQSRMPIGSEVIFPTYFAASNHELGGFDTIDSMFCGEGVGTTDGPWYVMLLEEDYGTLPVLPFPTALPVKNQGTHAIWVSVNWLVGSGLLPPLEHSYFVAPNGPGLPLSDGSIARPFKTIQEGIDTVPSGSALIIAANTYDEGLIFPDSKDLELIGFGGPVKIQPSAPNVTALTYAVVGPGPAGSIRIGLYHLQLITTGDGAGTPTMDIDFDGLDPMSNAVGTLVMDDVDVTRIGSLVNPLVQRVTSANEMNLTDVRVHTSVIPAGTTVFFTCGLATIANCLLGNVTENYDPTFVAEPLGGRRAHNYVSTHLADDANGSPAESLHLIGSPNVVFDEGCVLTGGITSAGLSGYAGPDIMPIIHFHGTALRGAIDLPAKVATANALLDLDRSQWTGPTGVLISNAEAVTPPRISARQMNIPGKTAALHLVATNVVVDARGLTGLIDGSGGAGTTCDRDKARAFAAPVVPLPGFPIVPGTPAVAPLLDDFGTVLSFPMGATYLVTAELDTGDPLGTGLPRLAVPIATSTHTNSDFAFGFNAADAAALGALTGATPTITFLALRYGA